MIISIGPMIHGIVMRELCSQRTIIIMLLSIFLLIILENIFGIISDQRRYKMCGDKISYIELRKHNIYELCGIVINIFLEILNVLIKYKLDISVRRVLLREFLSSMQVLGRDTTSFEIKGNGLVNLFYIGICEIPRSFIQVTRHLAVLFIYDGDVLNLWMGSFVLCMAVLGVCFLLSTWGRNKTRLWVNDSMRMKMKWLENVFASLAVVKVFSMERRLINEYTMYLKKHASFELCFHIVSEIFRLLMRFPFLWLQASQLYRRYYGHSHAVDARARIAFDLINILKINLFLIRNQFALFYEYLNESFYKNEFFKNNAATVSDNIKSNAKYCKKKIEIIQNKINVINIANCFSVEMILKDKNNDWCVVFKDKELGNYIKKIDKNPIESNQMNDQACSQASIQLKSQTDKNPIESNQMNESIISSQTCSQSDKNPIESNQMNDQACSQASIQLKSQTDKNPIESNQMNESIISSQTCSQSDKNPIESNQMNDQTSSQTDKNVKIFNIDKNSEIDHGYAKERNITELTQGRLSIMENGSGLFRKDVMFNLGYGTGLSNKNIVKRIMEYGFYKIFTNFPEGFHTKIKEDGSGLSSGQKQLVRFCRCILKDSDIYIFESPLDFLDSEARKLCIRNILKLKNKTVIILTSDLELISIAHNVI